MFRVCNGGDGSAYVLFYDSEKHATLLDEYDMEQCEGFAEGSVSTLTITAAEGPIALSGRKIISIQDSIDELEEHADCVEDTTPEL